MFILPLVIFGWLDTALGGDVGADLGSAGDVCLENIQWTPSCVIKNVANVKSAERCQKICQKEDSCEWFTYVTKTTCHMNKGDCWLRTEKLEQQDGLVFGKKNCETPISGSQTIEISNVTDLVGTWCWRDIFYDRENCGEDGIHFLIQLGEETGANCGNIVTDKIIHSSPLYKRNLAFGRDNYEWHTIEQLDLSRPNIITGTDDEHDEEVSLVKRLVAGEQASTWMLAHTTIDNEGIVCRVGILKQKLEDGHGTCSDPIPQSLPLEEEFGDSMGEIGMDFSSSIYSCFEA